MKTSKAPSRQSSKAAPETATSQQIAPAPQPQSVDLKTLAILLVRHFDLREGYFEAGPQLAIAVGSVNPPAPPGVASAPIPGVVLGIGGVVLQRVPTPTANSVDAREVNPGHAGS
ncbi:MAG: hypothetical protein KGL39_25600 [Patescibacteria group bacterium]|nr:hypothetical protein [Patescibacteria group bacterium]